MHLGDTISRKASPCMFRDRSAQHALSSKLIVMNGVAVAEEQGFDVLPEALDGHLGVDLGNWACFTVDIMRVEQPFCVHT